MNINHNEQQLLKMAKHGLKCQYQGAGSFVRSVRLEQEVQSKQIYAVQQIKCCGCGFSLDWYGEW